jgi:hypothetical protein
MLTKPKDALQSAMRLHLAGQRLAQHVTGQEPRPERTPVHVSCLRRIPPSGIKDASQNGMNPRIACRGSQILCAHKRTINPVSEMSQKSTTPSREHSTGNANTPRRPFPPLDTPHPRHPPRTVTPKGGKGTLGGSCCCWPTLHCFVSLWQKTLPAMIKAIAVRGHNGLRHILCKPCSR